MAYNSIDDLPTPELRGQARRALDYRPTETQVAIERAQADDERATPARKTPARPAIPRESERDLQAAIIEYAQLKGWKVAFFRPARVTRNGRETYETPVGADGKGFVDMVLVRDRVVWIECKSDKGKLTTDQENWRDWLKSAGQEWYCLKPSDWNELMALLA